MNIGNYQQQGTFHCLFLSALYIELSQRGIDVSTKETNEQEETTRVQVFMFRAAIRIAPESSSSKSMNEDFVQNGVESPEHKEDAFHFTPRSFQTASSSSEENSVFYDKNEPTVSSDEEYDDGDDRDESGDEERLQELMADAEVDMDEKEKAHLARKKAKQMRKRREKVERRNNKYMEKRKKEKMKIVNKVLKEVLPDLGAYNVASAISGPKKRFFKGWYVEIAKIMGCIPCSLHEAVIYNSLRSFNRTVKNLRKSGTLDVAINQYDNDGRTPLIAAIITKRELDEGDERDVNFMIDAILGAGADCNVPDSFNGMTPLLYAAALRDEGVCIKLLSYGASPHMCDEKCVTPAMMAAANNLTHCLRILLQKLVDVDAVDERGWTPLHYCAFAGFPNCIKLLLANGANRRVHDHNHTIPLDIARYRFEYIKKNPPITKKEFKAMMNVDHDKCVAELEDAKSRMADMGEEW